MSQFLSEVSKGFVSNKTDLVKDLRMPKYNLKKSVATFSRELKTRALMTILARYEIE